MIPAYPMSRTCPFSPPPELAHIQREVAPSQVRLWDGSTPWLVTRYEDARKVLADPRASANPDLPGYPHVSAGAAAQQQQVRTFLDMDGPQHRAQRRLLNREFTVRRSEARRQHIQQIAADLIDAMLAGPNPADLVSALALPLSSQVICSLLGVPYADHEFFEQASDTVISSSASTRDAVSATQALLGYLGALIDRKNETPGDDLISRLVTEQLRTGGITRDGLISMAHVLLIAGHETTANMIALGAVLLLQNPAMVNEIRRCGDPDLLANVVEELLRFLSIVQSGRRRIALADMKIGGKIIRAGEGIIVATDIANRDESAFGDPDILDIHRRARHHLAFGYGSHLCIGQALARVQLQVAFGMLIRRIPTLALACPIEDLSFRHSAVVYGVEELPVTWRRHQPDASPASTDSRR